MRGSSYQYCIRSLPETSARLPADANEDRPSPRSAASARIAIPSAPDWQKKPIRPAGGTLGARVALSRVAGSVLMRPRQLGPSTRMPLARARATNVRWATAPAGPASAKPAASTISPWTPLAWHDATTSATDDAGTAMIARSTAPGTSRTSA